MTTTKQSVQVIRWLELDDNDNHIYLCTDFGGDELPSRRIVRDDYEVADCFAEDFARLVAIRAEARQFGADCRDEAEHCWRNR